MLRLLQYMVAAEWPLRWLNPLFGHYNPFLPEHRADPYPLYHALRSRAPVYFSPVLRVWVLTRYADIVRVLQDPLFSSDRSQGPLFRRLRLMSRLPPDLGRAISRSLLMLDPPDHSHIRSLVTKAFTPRMVERLRPRIEAIADDLLEAVGRDGEMDLIRDLAYPLPVIVIAEMLGIPSADRARFKRWSDDLAVLLDVTQALAGIERAGTTFRELRAYFRPLFEERRRHPREDLVSALVTARVEGQALGEEDLLAVCGLILAAGHETTTNLIGNAVIALLRNPQERKRLQENPVLMRSAVEEFLRYDSPVQLADRLVTADCEVGGRRIRKGNLVWLLLGAGNRDPERFPEPDRLDLGRPDNHHLAFGHGIHFCLGAPLARLEAEVALTALLRRSPDFDGPPEPPVWKRSMVLRGPQALPLRL